MVSNPEHNLRIETIGNDLRSGFIITTPENIKYIFSNVEMTYSTGGMRKVVNEYTCPTLGSYVNPSNFEFGSRITSWSITRIELPTGDKIYFDYGTYDCLTPWRDSLTETYVKCGADWSNIGYNLFPFDKRDVSYSIDYHTGATLLKSIRWKDGRLDFVPGELRKDIRSNPYKGADRKPKTLGAIQLFQKNGNSPLLTYNFKYSYFRGKDILGNVVTPDYLHSRLKLDGISVKGTGSRVQNYSMEYNESEALPSKSCFSCDTWGYYNNSAPNEPFTSFVAATDHYSLEKVNNEVRKSNICVHKGERFGNGNKEPNEKALVGTLTALTTPTGGRTEFKYECNNVLDSVIYIHNRIAGTVSLNKQESDRHPVTTTFTMPNDGWISLRCSYTGLPDCLETENTTTLISISNGWYVRGLSNATQDESAPATAKYTINEDLKCKKGTYQVTLNAKSASAEMNLHLMLRTGTVQAYESTVGGIRIAEIKSPLGTKKFSYTNYAGNSSGVLNRRPIYGYVRDILLTTGYGYNGKLLIDGYYIAPYLSSVSLLPLENVYNNYFMGYTDVTVTQESAEETITEKSYFHNEKEFDFIHWEADRDTLLPLNGKLLEHHIYSGNELLKKTVNDYGYRLLHQELGFKMRPPFIPLNYYTPEYHVYLKSSEEISYVKLPGGKTFPKSTLTEFYYNEANYLPNEIVTKKGSEEFTHKIKYAIELNAKKYGQFFMEHNMVTLPVEEQFMSGPRQRLYKLLFHVHHQQPMLQPWKEYAFGGIRLYGTHGLYFDGDKSLDKVKPEITYLTYDSYGRNTSYASRAGQTVIQIWGYQHQHIIAEIANCTLNELLAQGIAPEMFADRDRPTDNDWELLHSLRYRLPRASVTVMQYEPLVGMTQKTDPRGVVTRYTYDEFSRLKEVVEYINGEAHVLQQIDYQYVNEQ